MGDIMHKCVIRILERREAHRDITWYHLIYALHRYGEI